MLQAADFDCELRSASLLYLTRDSEVRAVVLENQAYRFLVMNGAIQSVMDRRDPKAIVFAHQQLMLKELNQLDSSARVLELGLGGGSALRHVCYTRPDLHWRCIEQSSEVINLYWEYFQPPQQAQGGAGEFNPNHNIILSGSRDYLRRLSLQHRFELILCDVYDEIDNELLCLCVEHLTDDGVLVVNWLPHIQPQGDDSAAFFTQFSTSYELRHAMSTVPGFRNQIHRLQRRGS